MNSLYIRITLVEISHPIGEGLDVVFAGRFVLGYFKRTPKASLLRIEEFLSDQFPLVIVKRAVYVSSVLSRLVLYFIENITGKSNGFSRIKDVFGQVALDSDAFLRLLDEMKTVNEAFPAVSESSGVNATIRSSVMSKPIRGFGASAIARWPRTPIS